MTNLLFPGRHHLLTNFQLQYLTQIVSGDITSMCDVNGQPLRITGPVDTVIWAVTSANHSNTRRNPLPSHRREVAIEEFARQLDADSYVYLIDDVGTSPRFAEYVLKKIEVDSQGRFQLSPDNTVVGCSTPEVIELYERLGFQVLPFELTDRDRLEFSALIPAQLMEAIVECGRQGDDWRVDERFVRHVARATRRLYLKYDFGQRIIDLHASPTLTDDGDLTDTRDYNVYARAFDEGAQRKYELLKDHVQPGRIVDIGCCTGSLIQQLTHDDRFRESDFYGIEIARQLYTECLHRKQQGAFGNDHVFFYQQDFAARPLFAANSVNTFITCSLTHEIESYSGRDALLHFMSLLRGQLAPGGRWINLDVVGPEDQQRPVLARFNRQDGRNDDYQRKFEPGQRQQLKDYLAGLSTYARFLRFAEDFRQGQEPLQFSTETIDGEPFVELRLQDACEYLSKKDYLDNWQSEMHETFCFWSFSQWSDAAAQAGFRVHPQSRAYANPWIIENRYQQQAALFRRAKGGLQQLPYPVTNMLLLADVTA